MCDLNTNNIFHSRLMMYFKLVLVLQCVILMVDSCGILTHIIISHRAKEHYSSTTSTYNYRQLIEKHKYAFFAGSVYPDVFDDNRCSNGIYKNISDDMHWGLFLNATINYIRTLPQPWDDNTEKLVTFMFGMLSHQVSDMLFESIGIDQGFLAAMANIDFHGSFKDAKLAGNIGAEVVNLYLLYWDYMDFLIDPEWYVPTGDLINIYKEFYGRQIVDKEVIDICSTNQLIYAIEEEAGLRELYSDAAASSPFLINQLTDYFIGGIDDMSVWSQKIWNDAVQMLENGTRTCFIPNNTLYINCKHTDIKSQPLYNAINKGRLYSQSFKSTIAKEDFEVTPTIRGVIIKPSKSLKTMLQKRHEIVTQRKGKRPFNLSKSKSSANATSGDYNVNNTYAKFGWSLVVKDIDKDGNDDVIVGAPRYSEEGDAQRGRVYIIYGSDDGYMVSDMDSINVNNFPSFAKFVKGPKLAQSGFGSSVSVLDINLDGFVDLAVGAPAFSQEDLLKYYGAVFIYFGKANSRDFWEPNLVIRCQTRYCNLGHTLAVSDTNFDGKDDLVLATPFYQDNETQSGIVSSIVSSSELTKKTTLYFEDLTKQWRLSSSHQVYGWFGYNIQAKKKVLMISEPNYRLCSRNDCAISQNDTRSVGRLHIYNMGTELPIHNLTFTGTHEFQALGYSADIGYPYGDNSLILAVGIPGAAVNGSAFAAPILFPQAGVVVLYNITSQGQMTEVARFEGNRRYDRFGDLVKFDDVNGDNIDDLIISAPLFSDDWTGLFPELIPENGRVYIYFGGQHFFRGYATRQGCNYKHIVYPCPGRLVNITMDDRLGYASSRFGLHVDIIRTKHQRYIAYNAPYTNGENDAEESGIFTIFKL